MLSSVQIENFRAFKSLRISDLGRVNLFVGKNSSGKTTILEGVEMLVSGNKLASVVGCAARRGEIVALKEEEARDRQIDISHLFHGHLCEEGSSFTISGEEGKREAWLTCMIKGWEESADGDRQLFPDSYDLAGMEALHIRDDSHDKGSAVPLSASGAISFESFRVGRRQNGGATRETRPVHFLTTETVATRELHELWSAFALRDEEEKIIETLKVLEPRIERIAFILPAQRFGFYGGSATAGIYARIKGGDDRIPLGSLGDGVRHLLTVSLAVSRCEKGFVMVDEIDTGLHHSAMGDMWHAVIETARRLDVQVFATTHSLDCVRSLGWLHKREPGLCSEVRLHRVDAQSESTVAYGADEIGVAAEQNVELRGW